MKPKHISADYRQPMFVDKAKILARYLKTLSEEQLVKSMQISPKLANTVRQIINSWSTNQADLTYALDSFAGDIYSGLQVKTFSAADRQYADDHLRIVSGLYGMLRPLDGISPYRLEMAYKLPSPELSNLYKFWGRDLSAVIADQENIINLSSKEYSKAALAGLNNSNIIEPRFLTYSSTKKTNEFVVVHAKIARGAFAGWLIKNRVDELSALKDFQDLGYRYDASLSTKNQPVFVAREFGGIGLSIRLS